jgi:hypothetical protein
LLSDRPPECEVALLFLPRFVPHADQCVEHAVRDACDLGYLVTLVDDACATYSVQRQAASLAAVAGYCRQCTAAELLAELDEVAGRGSVSKVVSDAA